MLDPTLPQPDPAFSPSADPPAPLRLVPVFLPGPVLLLGLVFLLFGLVAGCGAGPGETLASGASSGPATAVASGSGAPEGARALEVRRGEVRPTLLLSGTLEAASGTVMGTPNVRVFPMQVRWAAEDGSEVSAGDRVLEFDNSQLASRLQDLQSRLQTAATDLHSQGLRDSDALERARMDLERRKVDHAKARLEADLPDGLFAAQELAQRKLAETKARLELEMAQREVEAKLEVAEKSRTLGVLDMEDARRELEEVQRGIERLTLRAPEDGVVQIGKDPSTGRPVRAGDNLWPGMEAARIPDLSTLQVEAALFDVDEGRLEEGQGAEVWLDAFPEERLEGTVTSIAPIAETPNPRSTRRQFRVTVAVDGLDPARMRPGMSVRLRITAPPVEGPVVPRESLWLRSEGFGGIETAVVLADGRTADVRLGPCDDWSCLLEEGPEVGTGLGLAAALRRDPDPEARVAGEESP